MLNSCFFSGRFVADPKVFNSDGVTRCVFTLAVEREKKRDDGEYDTDFFDFIAWRETAEFIVKYFHKGDLATVANARAQVHTYDTPDGTKQRKVEFLIDRIYFGQGKRKNT